MASKVKFVKKGAKFEVENSNMLADARKKFKDMLKIGMMQIYVEIGVGDSVPNDTDKIEKAIEGASDECEKGLMDDLNDLNKKLEQLQKEEKAGSKKAGSEASKLVKAHEKKLKDMPGDINIDLRKAAQKAITAQLKGAKPQLSSIGRSAYRGVFELVPDAFSETDVGEYVPYFNELGKNLAEAGKDIYKQLGEEEKLRDVVANELAMLMDKSTDEKQLKKLTDGAEKYGDFLGRLGDSLKKADVELTKMEKLAKKEDELKKDADTKKPLKTFRTEIDELTRKITNRGNYIKNVENVPRGGFTKDQLTEFSAKLNKSKPLTEHGKSLERAGKDLMEEAKDAAKG